jgi:putative membrane protein
MHRTGGRRRGQLVPNCPDRAGTNDRRTLPRPGATVEMKEAVAVMYAGSGMAWMMVFGAVAWLALVGLAGWALGRYLNNATKPPRVDRESPLEILERRYAEGAIDVADFDEARARIREGVCD